MLHARCGGGGRKGDNNIEVEGQPNIFVGVEDQSERQKTQDPVEVRLLANCAALVRPYCISEHVPFRF